MTNRYLFADESGDFTFTRAPNVSKYFILCTVTTSSLEVGAALHQLRHDLVWEKERGLGDYFHATSDTQAIRDRVFETALQHRWRVQATICEKAKARPQVRKTKARFYKYPWYYHLKHSLARHIKPTDRFLVTAASIGTKKERETFCNDLDDVMQQNLAPNCWAVDFRPARTDPCLQLADYCCWAISRKWERGDNRSFDLISDRITYEYELWKHSTTLYY
jgi:hypothetical protein